MALSSQACSICGLCGTSVCPPLAELGSALASRRAPRLAPGGFAALFSGNPVKEKPGFGGASRSRPGGPPVVSVPVLRPQGPGWPLRVDVGEAPGTQREAWLPTQYEDPVLTPMSILLHVC